MRNSTYDFPEVPEYERYREEYVSLMTRIITALSKLGGGK